jgi:hypothetical protein
MSAKINTGARILDGLRDALSGNFSAITIEGKRWIRAPVWQPIETAPRDGARILGTGGGLGRSVVEIVSYNERVGAWDAPNDTLDDRDDEPDGYNRPSHWMPLPAAPTSDEAAV